MASAVSRLIYVSLVFNSFCGVLCFSFFFSKAEFLELPLVLLGFLMQPER